MRTVLLRGPKANGRVALVDDDDYELVSRLSWHVRECRRPGCRDWGAYAQATICRDGRKTAVYMHKLITGWPMTDHVNHDGLDNQRSNLRPATPARNNHNHRPQIGHSSRFKGVTWLADNGKWQAAIQADGKSRYLGSFTAEEDAAEAYDAAALEAFGSYAYLNLRRAS